MTRLLQRRRAPASKIGVRTLIKVSVLLVGSIAATLLIFELIYRWQLVDTYKPELRAFNLPTDLDPRSDRETLLVMGDSFTAGYDTYPAIMRSSQNRYRVINAGISATGILEALAVAQRRFKTFRPSVFVYQVYVGNDLFNIRYPIGWGQVSFIRNLYWTVAQRLRSIGYLNYRAAQLSYAWHGVSAQHSSVRDEPFSPGRYAPNDKINLIADPWLLENHILVAGDRVRDYEVLLSKLRELLAYCEPGSCRAYVLVIPHCSQVTMTYLDNTRKLGARFSDVASLQEESYPFIVRMRESLEGTGYGHVRVLNPLRPLRELEEAGTRVYFQVDPHLRPNAQALLATFLLDQIRADE